MTLLKRVKSSFSWTHDQPGRLLVIGFALIILIGSILLTLPISTIDGQGLHYIDALFTATSATCVTGLVVVDTGTVFTLFGQWVILALIQVGGLGFMTMGTIIAVILGKKISYRQRQFVRESLNHMSIDGIVRLVKRVINMTLIIEALGAVLLFLRFLTEMSWTKALYFGIFHSVSNFNNAGFDLFGHFNSLTQYVNDPVVNIVIMLLIILGGLGFFVIVELFEYPQRKKLSLHSKVVLVTTTILIVVGAVVIFAIELFNPNTLGGLKWQGKIFASFYQSVASRTDGSNTIPIGDLHQVTLFFIIILMFIGASPGSTGGGIKTTTFVTLLGAVWAMIRGRQDVVFFRERIGQARVYKALTIAFAALVLIILVTMILMFTENQDFLKVLFETTSAFGTVGLSTGITPELTPIGKILISIVMFAGRLGPLTVAIAISMNHKDERFRYAEGRIIIG